MNYTETNQGSFPVQFKNTTNGAVPDDQIFIYGLGQDQDGQYCYLKPDGSMLPMNPEDANAPGHLTKNGINYAAYSFPISAATQFAMPAYIVGGRFYISVGSPMYIALPAAGGFAAPDAGNPDDPNNDVPYALFEFTWAFGQVAFGCNPSYVNSFGVPFSIELTRESDNYHQSTGITLTRDAVFERYASSVSSVFAPLAKKPLIVAPYLGFTPNDPGFNYLQPAIDEAWQHYEKNPFNFTLGSDVFVGNVVGDQLVFSMNGTGSYSINKPTTYDLFAGANTMASGNDVEKMLEAQLVAAFNRGVALDTTQWLDATAYWPDGALFNEYARVFHLVSENGLAYGFSYDDVNNQSGVLILSSADPAPTLLTLSIAW